MFNVFYKKWMPHECEPNCPMFRIDWFKHSTLQRKYRAFAIEIDFLKKGYTFTFVLYPEEYMIDNYLDLDHLYDSSLFNIDFDTIKRVEKLGEIKTNESLSEI